MLRNIGQCTKVASRTRLKEMSKSVHMSIPSTATTTNRRSSNTTEEVEICAAKSRSNFISAEDYIIAHEVHLRRASIEIASTNGLCSRL